MAWEGSIGRQVDGSGASPGHDGRAAPTAATLIYRQRQNSEEVHADVEFRHSLPLMRQLAGNCGEVYVARACVRARLGRGGRGALSPGQQHHGCAQPNCTSRDQQCCPLGHLKNALSSYF